VAARSLIGTCKSKEGAQNNIPFRVIFLTFAVLALVDGYSKRDIIDKTRMTIFDPFFRFSLFIAVVARIEY
jgi:hypothetical protein